MFILCFIFSVVFLFNTKVTRLGIEEKNYVSLIHLLSIYQYYFILSGVFLLSQLLWSSFWMAFQASKKSFFFPIFTFPDHLPLTDKNPLSSDSQYSSHPPNILENLYHSFSNKIILKFMKYTFSIVDFTLCKFISCFNSVYSVSPTPCFCLPFQFHFYLVPSHLPMAHFATFLYIEGLNFPNNQLLLVFRL